MDKSGQKHQKWSNFRKPEACRQTVLPDMSILIGPKLVKNAKIQMRHFRKFQTLLGQTELPDRSILIGQKLVENTKIQMSHFG